MTDHDCPQWETCTVHAGETSICVEEVYQDHPGHIMGGVCVIVDDGEGAAAVAMEPEEALEVAAGIAEAAHRALWRRELAGDA